jgi:hypothetical protein
LDKTSQNKGHPDLAVDAGNSMKKKRIVRILRIIMPIVAIISAVVFVPWDIVPWIAPLPDTVQEQVDDAIDHGLDGIIVYVDQSGKAPAFYSAGWKNKVTQVPADPHALFKIGSIHKLYITCLNLLDGLNMQIRLP